MGVKWPQIEMMHCCSCGAMFWLNLQRCFPSHLKIKTSPFLIPLILCKGAAEVGRLCWPQATGVWSLQGKAGGVFLAERPSAARGTAAGARGWLSQLSVATASPGVSCNCSRIFPPFAIRGWSVSQPKLLRSSLAVKGSPVSLEIEMVPRREGWGCQGHESRRPLPTVPPENTLTRRRAVMPLARTVFAACCGLTQQFPLPGYYFTQCLSIPFTVDGGL